MLHQTLCGWRYLFTVPNLGVLFSMLLDLVFPVKPFHLPWVLWYCWFGVRKSIWPVNNEWWGPGVVICLRWGANDMHIVQLMLQPPHHASLKPRLIWCFGAGLARLPWKRGYEKGVLQPKRNIFLPSLDQFSLLPSAGWKISAGQSAVTLCDWGVKAGMVHSTCG